MSCSCCTYYFVYSIVSHSFIYQTWIYLLVLFMLIETKLHFFILVILSDKLNCMKVLAFVLHEKPFLTQPWLEPAASGLQDCGVDHWATATPYFSVSSNYLVYTVLAYLKVIYLLFTMVETDLLVPLKSLYFIVMFYITGGLMLFKIVWYCYILHTEQGCRKWDLFNELGKKIADFHVKAKGYKTISKQLYLPVTTVASAIKKALVSWNYCMTEY